MADGYLNFDTKVNTSGFEKGKKKIVEEYLEIQKQAEQTQKKLLELYSKQEKFDASGVKKESTAYKNLQLDIENTTAELQRLTAQLTETDRKNLDLGVKDNTATEFLNLQKEIESTGAKLNTLYSRLDKYQSLEKNPQGAEFKSLQYDIEQTEAKLAELKAKAQEPVYVDFDTSGIDNITSRSEEIKIAFDAIKDGSIDVKDVVKIAFSKIGDTLKGIGSKATEAGSSIIQAFKNAGSKVKSFFKSFKSGDSTITKTIKKLGSIRKMLGRMLLRKIFNAMFKDIQENLGYLAKISPQFNKDFSSLKNGLSQVGASFITAFQPILEVVAPILERFLSLLAEVGNKLGEFFSALTGKSTTIKATKQNTDYAKSLDKTAKSADKASKALGAYDKLQVISQENNSNSGSETGTNPYTTTTVTEDVSSFADEVKKAWENADFSGIGKTIQDKVISSLNSINWEKITEKGKQIASSVATGINGFFSLDENGEATLGKSIGSYIANALSSATSIFDTFIWKIDAYAIGRNITTALQTAFKDYNWYTFGHALSGILIKGTDFITGLVDGVNWEELPGEVWNAVKEAFLGFDFDSFFDSQENLIMSFHNEIDGLIDGIFSPVTDWLDREFKKIKVWWQGEDGKGGKKAEISKWFSSLPSAISSGIGNIWAKVKTKFEDFKKKVKIWWQGEDGKSGFKGYIKDKFSSLPSAISSGIGNIWAKVKTKFEDFKKKVKIWWQGEDGKGGFKKTLKDKFKIDFSVGKWADLKNKLKNIINSVIDWANKNVVPKLQKLFQFTIPDNKAAKVLLPDDMLGKSYNLITVPKIPKLATGTVVPANNGEFLSILGDNKKEPEIVSPLSTMREAVREELNSQKKEPIVIQFGKKILTTLIWDEAEKRYKQTGRA